MARPNVIVSQGLETVVLEARAAGKTAEQVLEACNEALKARMSTIRISPASLARYIASLSAAATPALHQPQIATAQIASVIEIADRVQNALRDLDQQLILAKTERDSRGDRQFGAIVGLTAEARKQVTMYANIMDKLYNMQRIAIFQQAVLDAIEEADPATAAKVRENLRRHHEIRRAAMLGA